MPKATRGGVDTAGGGIITAVGQSFVTVEGSPWVTVGDPVASHGDSPHDAATMAAGSSLVSIDGVAVCRAGDLATCGDPATGGSLVEVG